MKDDTIYDHYIAIDWSIKNMAIARMTKKSNKITAIDVPSDIEDLKAYLKNLRGTKILTIEETTTATARRRTPLYGQPEGYDKL